MIKFQNGSLFLLGFSFEALETSFVALESIFEVLETIFYAGWIFFWVRQRQKWPLGVAGSLSPWPLGWIAATPKGRISFFFFPPEKSSEKMVGGGVCSSEVGGGQR
jgi:hypothetical protein